MQAFIEGIGLRGPGLADWAQAMQCLVGTAPYVPQRCVLPPAHALPPAERRRAGAAVKVSLGVAQEAVDASGLVARELPSVFSSSSGDPANCHEICSMLASNDKLISPTRFHNSVHNASSGYWSISSGSMASSTALCARDGGFSAGLLEAMTQCCVDGTTVLLVAYDAEYPQPLFGKRPIPDSMGVALVLSPARTERSHARIRLDPAACITHRAADVMQHAQLEALRRMIPAARSLPLLQAIAMKQTRALALDYLEPMRLALEIEAC